jgi:hypothetical protein
MHARTSRLTHRIVVVSIATCPNNTESDAGEGAVDSGVDAEQDMVVGGNECAGDPERERGGDTCDRSTVAVVAVVAVVAAVAAEMEADEVELDVQGTEVEVRKAGHATREIGRVEVSAAAGETAEDNDDDDDNDADEEEEEEEEEG